MSKATTPAIGETVILHDDATAQAYRQVTADAHHRHQSGLPPQGSLVTSRPAGPAEPVLPYIGPARAALSRELALLQGQAGDRERWLSGSGIGAGGVPMMQVPGYATQRQAVTDELEVIRATITRLSSLAADDQAVRQWAFDHGVR